MSAENTNFEVQQEDKLRVKPEGFENYLSDYRECIFDGSCGEPIMWGFAIIKYLGTEKFAELKRTEVLECSGPGSWFVIRKRLNKQEAIDKYGEITEEKCGPRGGHISVTYGTKRFLYKLQ